MEYSDQVRSVGLLKALLFEFYCITVYYTVFFIYYKCMNSDY